MCTCICIYVCECLCTVSPTRTDEKEQTRSAAERDEHPRCPRAGGQIDLKENRLAVDLQLKLSVDGCELEGRVGINSLRHFRIRFVRAVLDRKRRQGGILDTVILLLDKCRKKRLKKFFFIFLLFSSFFPWSAPPGNKTPLQSCQELSSPDTCTPHRNNDV